MSCSCKQHYRWQTIKAAQQAPYNLECKVCPGGRASLSQPALQAARALQGAPYRWAYESRALRGKYGPLDFYFPDIKLAVEVDGEQHYKGSMFGVPHPLQRARDTRKMAAAWEAGIRVLRVPYFAADCLEQPLQRAINECVAHPTLRFIMWSTDPHDRYGAFERAGDACDAWLQRVDTARAAAQVRACLEARMLQPLGPRQPHYDVRANLRVDGDEEVQPPIAA